MTFYERAWKERVRSEDRALLDHTLAMQEQMQSSGNGRRTPQTPSLTSSMRLQTRQRVPGGQQQRQQQQQQQRPLVAPKVGSCVASSDCDAKSDAAPSVAPSAKSSKSSQLSHRGASTVGGSSVISGLTGFSTRLTKLEEKLERDREERKAVHQELAEIKALLMQQAKSKSGAS